MHKPLNKHSHAYSRTVEGCVITEQTTVAVSLCVHRFRYIITFCKRKIVRVTCLL